MLFMLTEGMEGGRGDSTFACLHFCCCRRMWHPAPDQFLTSGLLRVLPCCLQLPPGPHWLPVPISSHQDHPAQFCKSRKKEQGFTQFSWKFPCCLSWQP